VPDRAAICDTSYEVESTWTYLREVMQPYLDRTCGLEIQIVPHDWARVDLCDKSGLTLVPAYTADGGRLSAFCSAEWKRDCMERWLRWLGVVEAVQWIGFSIDEFRRAKKDHRPWLHLEFPLIDLFVNRAICQTIIREAGLPLPHKSRCACCPHQNADEWAEVRANPADWQTALRVEAEINRLDPRQSGLYLHSDRVPLETVVIGQSTGSTPCDSSSCWT
jgi:hypothetical protein